MNWLVFHVASGQSFFSGIALIIVAALASTRSHPIAGRVTVLAFSIGAIAIVISSTAIPYWCYAVAVLVTVAWVSSRYVTRWRRWSPWAEIAVWAIAAALEVPYHLKPALAPVRARSMTIIGDSVTAGMGVDDESVTWPRILAMRHNIQVQDFSHVGETAGSAMRRVSGQRITAPVVLVEIGGNDLLGSTSAAKFSQDLDALLALVSSPQRQVVMFELPLPPFCHEYGRVQRALAKKHGVLLVPKRVFLSILAVNDSTLDTIHLSQAGHQRMADCVWGLVGSAFSTQKAASSPESRMAAVSSSPNLVQT